MNDYIYLVLSNPTPGLEDEFNRYYDTVHLPELLEIPGLARATRYQISERRANQAPLEGYSYVCVYEFDDDPVVALDRLTRHRQAGRLTPSDAISREPPPQGLLFQRRSHVDQRQTH